MEIIKELKKVNITKPIFIEGMPGIGYVGKLTADYIIKKMNMEKIAEIYSPYLPPEVKMLENGLIEPISYGIYYTKKGKQDYLLVTGEAQPPDSIGQFKMNKIVIDYIKKFKPAMILTIGGYGTGKVKKETIVYGATNDKQLIKQYKDLIVFGKSPGNIFGAAGQLLMFAKMEKISGLCLMGSTHGSYIDARAAEAIIKTLNKMFKMNIKLDDLDEQVKNTDKIIKEIQKELKNMEGAKPKLPSKGSYL